jgi:hypothetical protein
LAVAGAVDPDLVGQQFLAQAQRFGGVAAR